MISVRADRFKISKRNQRSGKIFFDEDLNWRRRNVKPDSAAHLAVADADPFVGGQFVEAHGTARADLVGADTDLGAHAEFATVGETGAGVPINSGGIHAG